MRAAALEGNKSLDIWQKKRSKKFDGLNNPRRPIVR
jgi:hypothetical protein